jgi:hypothetical protein
MMVRLRFILERNSLNPCRLHCEARMSISFKSTRESEPMYRFATDHPLDVEEFRAPLRKMTDAELLKYGRAEQ